MERTQRFKLIPTALTLCLLAAAQASYAAASGNANAAVTIENGSLNWADAAARDKLLSQAPKWSPQAMATMFDEYIHPERHHFPIYINGTYVNYNAMYIQGLFGPRNNPFAKYPRPAKVFIFTTDSAGNKKYFMACLIQNDNDKNYYVFDKGLSQPMTVKEWVFNKTDGFPCSVRFNVCTGYGVLPTDTCEGQNYEGELYRDPYAITSRKHKLNDNHTAIPSARRDIQQDWQDKATSLRPAKNKLTAGILDSSVAWADRAKRTALLNTTVTWPNYKVIQENFVKVRDMRYFQDEAQSGFARRITWLYPDDGCWSRASAVIKDFFGPLNNAANAYQRPSKVFAFGNLCVNTNNSPTGRASWWYHFAPIVRDAETNQTYVLDPSINPTAPMPIEQWVTAISATNGKCSQTTNNITTFNICNGYGVSPYDRCEFSRELDFESEIRSVLLQQYYRKFERDRQVELGRDPNAVLGDAPPWSK